jgi:hypothetical protein
MLSDIEPLRAELQVHHRQHVLIELSLTETFLDMGRLQFQMGETGNGERSIANAKMALGGAKAGITRIHSSEIRSELEALVAKCETDNPQLSIVPRET